MSNTKIIKIKDISISIPQKDSNYKFPIILFRQESINKYKNDFIRIVDNDISKYINIESTSDKIIIKVGNITNQIRSPRLNFIYFIFTSYIKKVYEKIRTLNEHHPNDKFLTEQLTLLINNTKSAEITTTNAYNNTIAQFIDILNYIKTNKIMFKDINEKMKLYTVDLHVDYYISIYENIFSKITELIKNHNAKIKNNNLIYLHRLQKKFSKQLEKHSNNISTTIPTTTTTTTTTNTNNIIENNRNIKRGEKALLTITSNNIKNYSKEEKQQLYSEIYIYDRKANKYISNTLNPEYTDENVSENNTEMIGVSQLLMQLNNEDINIEDMIISDDEYEISSEEEEEEEIKRFTDSPYADPEYATPLSEFNDDEPLSFITTTSEEYLNNKRSKLLQKSKDLEQEIIRISNEKQKAQQQLNESESESESELFYSFSDEQKTQEINEDLNEEQQILRNKIKTLETNYNTALYELTALRQALRIMSSKMKQYNDAEKVLRSIQKDEAIIFDALLNGRTYDEINELFQQEEEILQPGENVLQDFATLGFALVKGYTPYIIPINRNVDDEVSDVETRRAIDKKDFDNLQDLLNYKKAKGSIPQNSEQNERINNNIRNSIFNTESPTLEPINNNMTDIIENYEQKYDTVDFVYKNLTAMFLIVPPSTYGIIKLVQFSYKQIAKATYYLNFAYLKGLFGIIPEQFYPPSYNDYIIPEEEVINIKNNVENNDFIIEVPPNDEPTPDNGIISKTSNVISGTWNVAKGFGSFLSSIFSLIFSFVSFLGAALNTTTGLIIFGIGGTAILIGAANKKIVEPLGLSKQTDII